MDTIFTTLGTNKGALRLWLEGQHLFRHDFKKGDRYDRVMDIETNTIILKRSEFGKYVVSGKTVKSLSAIVPVIDINTKQLETLCHEGEKLKINLSEGVIVISMHHLEKKRRERETSFNQALSNKHFTKGTFCVGAGMANLAMKQGFEGQGFTSETKWAVDRELNYLNVFMRQNASCLQSTRVHCADLEELEPNDLSAVNVCQFSLDCASHSKSGKAKNGFKLAEEHKNSTGLYGLLKSLEHVNAGVYISENVIEARQSASYMLIKNTLHYLGYVIYETDLDSEQSGCIENRPRYWMIAISKGLAFNDSVEMPRYDRTYRNLGELMECIDEHSPMWSDNEYLKAKAIRDAKAGKGFKRQLVNETTTSVGVINRHYAKKQSTPPMIVRPDGKERIFTVSEHAKIKGCDLSLIEGLGQTLGHEILGQGIDMKQGQGVSEFIILAMKVLHDATQKPMIHEEIEDTQIPLFDNCLH